MDHLVETNVLKRKEGTKKTQNKMPQQTWVPTEMWSLTGRHKQHNICNHSGPRDVFMFHILDLKNKLKKKKNTECI